MANLMLALLCFLFLATLASSLVQVSIDCGASNPYTDKNGIKWVTDESYTSNGENHAVKTAGGSAPEPLKTLRVFSSRRKNCYSVAIKGGGQVRVRVSFSYGNYDGNSSPPSFELLVDGNDWDTVQTSMDSENHYEGIYVVTGDSTSVCVAQTSPGQLPFVSAIQVWELEQEMYGHFDPSTSLLLVNRYAFGPENSVRYPDDAYDRIWDPVQIPDSLAVLKSDAATFTINITDRPPAAVLKTAITLAPSDPTGSIALLTGLPSDPVPIYMNLYFAETSQLGPNDKRSFALVVDGEQISDAITPVYARALEFFMTNVSCSGTTNITLQATSESTLPPIINAMEVFAVSDAVSNGTDATDVRGLASLIRGFDALKDWSGDPCLPQNFSWDWVGCSSDDTPRVTSLDLSGYELSGEIPDLSSMDALQTIDFHNNSISGAIPDFLNKLPNLQELNLADNSLSGPIPSSLSNNKNLKLVTSGNPDLCAAGQSCRVISTPANSPGNRKSHYSSANKRSSNLGSFLGLVIPFSFVLAIL